MRAKFIRGVDPKDSLKIGLPHIRARSEMERILTEISNEYGGKVEIQDPAWQGVGNVIAIISFPKGYQKSPEYLPTNYGYRFRFEYETGREHPLTIARSVAGEDWQGSYLDDINQSSEILKRWLDQMNKKK
jgi:hypothetical protein